MIPGKMTDSCNTAADAVSKSSASNLFFFLTFLFLIRIIIIIIKWNTPSAAGPWEWQTMHQRLDRFVKTVFNMAQLSLPKARVIFLSHTENPIDAFDAS